MTSRNGTEIYTFVNEYFEALLEQGLTIMEVIDTFRQDILSPELMNSGYPEKSLRRYGQMVSTKYLIQERDIKQAQVTSLDVFGPK